MSGLLRGFPQFPDDNLESKLYNALMPVYLAIQNLNSQYGLYTGVDSYPPEDWSQLNNTDAYTGWTAKKGYFQANEDLTAGHLVRLVASGAGVRVMKAIATSAPNMAIGIANATVFADQFVEVLMWEGVTGLIGSMTPGTPYYLSASSAGFITNVRPAASTNIIQCIGVALSASKLLFNIGSTVIVNP